MGSAIEAINLTKYYDDLLAVDDINLQVEQGEIFGFLGPNGAGKTTTIRMLTGISIPTEGTPTIIGYDIKRQSVSAKEQMGIVPDVSNVYKDLSAWDKTRLVQVRYSILVQRHVKTVVSHLARTDLSQYLNSLKAQAVLRVHSWVQQSISSASVAFFAVHVGSML